jgi:hypothetical protein
MPQSKATGGPGPVTPEVFVRAWEHAQTVQEVMDELDITYAAAVGRATHYRKHGVPLKLLTGIRRHTDYARLQQIVADIQHPRAEESA